jgi:uncharacterized protein (DUF433 family)
VPAIGPRFPGLEISGSAVNSALSQGTEHTVAGAHHRIDGVPVPPYPRRVDYRHLITIGPDKRGGKPCIRGLRITVYDVLEYLASGMSGAEILRDFPDLTPEDIRACLAFAADRERRLVSIPPA